MGAAVLRWEAPPEDGRRAPVDRPRSHRRDYSRIAVELQSRPGEWALVAECPARSGYIVAQRMRTGDAVGFRPAGAFEAEARQFEEGTRVYARFVGRAS
jgi:hypothetical protein